jgi:GTP cyclohydrolase III
MGDDPFASKSSSLTEPRAHAKSAEAAKPAEAEKPKTPEDFDKQIADAKTPEDYRAVAGEALRAAGQAMDDHRQDTARQLILKSLVAARKSGDSRLIIKATRALTKPESVNAILAEEDKHSED